MVTSKIEPCNRKSVDNFFQNRQESDRATFKFIFTIPRTDRSGYRPCPSTDMIVLKHHFILHESPRRPSVRPLETTESVHSSAAYLCEKKYICEYQNSCWGLRPCPHESVLIWKRNFFFMDTASVHTNPMKTINENGTFRKRSPEIRPNLSGSHTFSLAATAEKKISFRHARRNVIYKAKRK